MHVEVVDVFGVAAVVVQGDAEDETAADEGCLEECDGTAFVAAECGGVEFGGCHGAEEEFSFEAAIFQSLVTWEFRVLVQVVDMEG